MGGSKLHTGFGVGPSKRSHFWLGSQGMLRGAARVLSVSNEGRGRAGESRAGLEGAGGAGGALSDPEPRALISLETWLSSGVS